MSTAYRNLFKKVFIFSLLFLMFSYFANADERGTREYNLALGERRANAAKDYLMTYGVSGKRISVISYGKEKPVNPASSPLAWSQNRRSVTIKAN